MPKILHVFLEDQPGSFGVNSIEGEAQGVQYFLRAAGCTLAGGETHEQAGMSISIRVDEFQFLDQRPQVVGFSTPLAGK